jgi:hypothetical protein
MINKILSDFHEMIVVSMGLVCYRTIELFSNFPQVSEGMNKNSQLNVRQMVLKTTLGVHTQPA